MTQIHPGVLSIMIKLIVELELEIKLLTRKIILARWDGLYILFIFGIGKSFYEREVN